MGNTEYDIVVVGAGTSGANAAYQFARRGRRVLIIERRPAVAAGAQWRNGVLDRHFIRAGLEAPSGDERGTAGNTVHLRARDPLVGPTLRNAPTVSADMSQLGDRLRTLALEAGAELIDNVQGFDVDVDGATGRIRALSLTEAGTHPKRTVGASLFVDASGRRGALRRHSPDLARWCPPVSSNELCSASDAHHEVRDRAGAERFLDRHGALPGEAVTLVGISGGFSTCALTVAADLSHVGILIGCLASHDYGPLPRLATELSEREPWIGAAMSSGSGTIPLRRPYARITAAGIALVGDSACQVFPAHGSGIGIGLVAGTMLADGLIDVDDLGNPHRLWARYQTPFQRELGGELLAFDMLRRLSTALGETGVDALIRSGVIDEHRARTSLDQRWAPPPVADAVRTAGRLARQPRLASVMVPALTRAQLLHAHGASYPDRLDLDALARWERRTERLLGSLPQ